MKYKISLFIFVLILFVGFVSLVKYGQVYSQGNSSGVSLTINGSTSGVFGVGEKWTLKVTTNPKMRNSEVKICGKQDNKDFVCVPAGQLESGSYIIDNTRSIAMTDQNGEWILSGIFDSDTYAGNWSEYVIVGEKVSNTINFVVKKPSDSSGADLKISNRKSHVFALGENWTLKLTTNPKMANKPVSVCGNQNSTGFFGGWLCVPASELNSSSYTSSPSGSTDQNGEWTLSGRFDSDTLGDWLEYILIGDSSNKIASNLINFSVKKIEDLPDAVVTNTWFKSLKPSLTLNEQDGEYYYTYPLLTTVPVGEQVQIYSSTEDVNYRRSGILSQNIVFYNFFEILDSSNNKQKVEASLANFYLEHPTKFYTTPFVFNKAGNYRIRGCVDTRENPIVYYNSFTIENDTEFGKIRESNEQNNCSEFWSPLIVREAKFTINNATSGSFMLGENWALKLTTDPIISNKRTEICGKGPNDNDYVCIDTNQLTGKPYFNNVPGTTNSNGVFAISGYFDDEYDMGKWSQYMKVHVDNNEIVTSNVVSFDISGKVKLSINDKNSGVFYGGNNFTLKATTVSPSLANKRVQLCLKQDTQQNWTCRYVEEMTSLIPTSTPRTNSQGVWSGSGKFSSNNSGNWSAYIKVGDVVGSEENSNQITYSIQPDGFYPDLTAYGGYTWPTYPIIGSDVTFYSTAENLVNYIPTSDFYTFFQVASGPNGTGTTTDISPVLQSGFVASSSPRVIESGSTYKFNSAGIYSFRMCVDKSNSTSTGVIPENNENNNCSGWTNVSVATHTLTINNKTSGKFNVGESWTLRVVTNPVLSNKLVQFCRKHNNNSNNCTYADQLRAEFPAINSKTDANGVWMLFGVFNSGNLGNWVEYLKIGDISGSEALTNPIDFSVQSATTTNNTATANIYANNTQDYLSVSQGSPVVISWNSTNSNSCTVLPLNISGTNGSSNQININDSTIYTISCQPQGPNSYDSVLVEVPSNSSATSTAVTIIKAGQGSVTSVPAGINCGAGCSSQTVYFPTGTNLELKAVPSNGRIFTGWSVSGLTNPCVGRNEKCNIVINSPKSIIVNFAVESGSNLKEF